MPTAQELDHIAIRGAREHNLKNVDLNIPKKKLVVFTGVSGSGKSSLAFDTLFAEGQRRYVESLSAYARQFLGQMDKPRYETIRGLGPTISIEQKTTGQNPRSTVGTITEISDYLRVLFARIGHQHCYQCGRPVKGQSAAQVAQELQLGTEPITLLAPVLVNRKGEHRKTLEDARQAGYVRVRVDGRIERTEGLEALDKRKKHSLELVIDRLTPSDDNRARLEASVETAFREGKGTLLVASANEPDRLYSQHLACDYCNISFPELTPQSFSFNSPQGMCQACNGLGTRVELDPGRIVTNPDVSIDDGAIAPWGEDVSEKTTWDFRSQILERLGIDAKKPYKHLSKAQQKILLYGTGETKYEVTWKAKSGQGQFQVTWEGIIPKLMRRFRQTQSERARKWYAQFMGDAECTECEGARLRKESAAVRVGGKTLVEISQMTVADAVRFFRELALPPHEQTIAKELSKEIQSRLGFLEAVGLEYLSLDRAGPTLSGGEAQRIRLASQVGSELSGVIYVLDEPSIGLHQRDNERLLRTLCQMRDLGNSVVCVEHDEDTIRSADYVVDFGPGAGVEGGHVVFGGTPAALAKARSSLTGDYLSGRKRIAAEPLRAPSGQLALMGASGNNLKRVNAHFPLGVLTAVTGVSGAGKSTLVNDILCEALRAQLAGEAARGVRFKSLNGAEDITRLITIDQRAIGRTPRSNPSTYIKVFDEIRRFFAELPEARARGFTPGRFSFNVKGGRCEACEGDGSKRIEMHFLPDVFVRCEQCQGLRYNQSTLDVRYRGRSIADVLELTVAEALELFATHPKLRGPLTLLMEVGLDYVKLGQPSPTLSGGEAQRIKLAKELSKRPNGHTFYVLDEPTTGLHFDDIRRLMAVLHRLVDAGNTVLVIEHNLDVIRCADWVIDLGPEGGPLGGEIIATGPPEEVARVEHSHTGRFLAQALRRHPRGESEKASTPRRASPRRSRRSASAADDRV